MNDLQPQYFAVGADAQAPAPRPWWKTWKLAALGGGVLVVALLTVLLVNIVRQGSVDDTRVNALSAMEVALQACDTDRDPETCKDRVRSAAAQGAAGTDACDGMTGDAQASCVSLAAKADGDVAACKDLADEDREACEDLAWLTTANADENVEMCDKIANSRLATKCRVQVTAHATAAGTCAEAHVDEALCTAAAALRAAIATGSPAECNTLAEDQQESCTAAIATTDDDDDGLTAQEEYELGTSDTNADTDGDGYNDGDEVAAGYDPLR